MHLRGRGTAFEYGKSRRIPTDFFLPASGNPSDSRVVFNATLQELTYMGKFLG